MLSKLHGMSIGEDMRQTGICTTLLLAFVFVAEASAQQHYLDLTEQTRVTTSGLPGSKAGRYTGYARPAPPPFRLDLERAGLNAQGKPYIEFRLRNEGKGVYLLAASFGQIASLRQGCTGRHLVFVKLFVREPDSSTERLLTGNALAGSSRICLY